MKKTKDIPRVYYFNYDNMVDRQKHIESQLSYYKIPYKQVNKNLYTSNDSNTWLKFYEDCQIIVDSGIDRSVPANLLNYLFLMKSWLSETNDQYLIIMKDTCDLSIIDYWHFDWSYLMSSLPCDWEAIKLSVLNSFKINFFLSPVNKMEMTEAGPMLFKRSFVEKLMTIFFTSEGLVTSYDKRSVGDAIALDPLNQSCWDVNRLLPILGSVYSLPIITIESSLYDDSNIELKNDAIILQRAYHDWWKNRRDLFSVEDFFTYNKPYDYRMSCYLNHKI